MRRSFASRFAMLALASSLALVSLSCGSGSTAAPDPNANLLGGGPGDILTVADVQNVVAAAAASVNVPIAIAVTDRSGHILAVYDQAGVPTTSIGNFSQSMATNEVAVGLARTASFFSNDQAPLSSRTVRYISGAHFPPGIMFAPNAALYGIENTNRGCFLTDQYLSPAQSLPQARSIDGTTTGAGVVTGKKDVFDSDANAVNPGGVPIFKNGHLAGGVGVAGAANPSVDEFAAFSGAAASGVSPIPVNPLPAPGIVIIDGVGLPFVNQKTLPKGVSAGVMNGSYAVAATGAPGPTPDGDLIARTAGTVGSLTLDDVNTIVNAAIANANQTRAVIRLPLESRARFAIAVVDLDGRLLALNRMPDATIFSVDVAVGKARNMIWFNRADVPATELPGVPPGISVTNRTISFGAQPFFPPGINGSSPGPFFGLYKFDTANPCTNGHQPANRYQNGIVFFPGSIGLYKNGQLVGGLGISGDGVEQDDYVTGQASVGYQPPTANRADQIQIKNVRLPFLKFPRNPTD